jgi:molybdate transport system ATP-binding protein
MLEVDIYKDYGNFVLDVKFASEDPILGILGASGSGKSLTLKAIAGIVKPDRGRIVLDGKVLFDSSQKINLRPQDRRVGFLLQDYALFPQMTVYENIKAGLREIDEKGLALLESTLEEMRLTKIRDNLPHEISGGQKQRTALARILVNDAKLLLLDEPYSDLDSYLRWKIEYEIKSIIENHQIPTLFVSHDRDEIYRMCDAIVIMKDGKSEERRMTKDLFTNPISLAGAELSGCKNFSDLNHVRDNIFWAKDWGLALELVNYKTCDKVGIRSHYIFVSDKPLGPNSFGLDLIKEIEELFGYTLIAKPTDSKSGFLRIELGKSEWESLRTKKDLYFNIDEDKLLYLNK